MDFYDTWLDRIKKAKLDILNARKELTILEQDLIIHKEKQRKPKPNIVPFEYPVIQANPEWSIQMKPSNEPIPDEFLENISTKRFTDMLRIEQDPELMYHMADAMAYNFKLMQEEIEHKKYKAFVSELPDKFQRPSTVEYASSFGCNYGVSALYKDPDKLAVQRMYPHLLFSDKIPMYYGFKGDNYVGLLRVSETGQVHRILFNRHKIDLCMANVAHNIIPMNQVFYADSQTIRDIMEYTTDLRGFSGGKMINQGALTNPMEDSVRKIPVYAKGDIVEYNSHKDRILVNGRTVYSNGIWAEVIEPTLEEIAEKANVSVSYLKNLLRDEE